MRKLGKGMMAAAFILVAALGAGCATGKTYTQNGEQISIDEGLYLKALNYQRSEDFARALQAWEELLEKSPTCALAYINRAKIFDRLNMVPDAIRAYEMARRYEPNNTETMANLGAAYLRAGRVNQALDILNECITKDPYRPAAYYCLAGAYLEAGQLDKAVINADIAVDLVAIPSRTTESGLDPSVDRERLGHYLMRQAECHIERGEFDKAKICLDRVVKQCNMKVPAELAARIPAEQPKNPG